MTAVAPLPCPFCRWEPTVHAVAPDHVQIECVYADCAAGPFTNGRDVDNAIARWNTRAPVTITPDHLLALADTMPDQPDLADRLRQLAARERGWVVSVEAVQVADLPPGYGVFNDGPDREVLIYSQFDEGRVFATVADAMACAWREWCQATNGGVS